MTVALEDGAWRGENVLIVGGGPSVRAATHAIRHLVVESSARVIAIKAAIRMMPDADVHLACDRRYWRLVHTGGLGVDPATLRGVNLWTRIGHSEGYRWLTEVPALPGWTSRSVADGLCANHSGSAALDLARLMGAEVIYLSGFDGRTEDGLPVRYHGGYPWDGRQEVKRTYDAMAECLRAFPGRCAVAHLAPGSVYDWWPVVDVCDALAR